MTSTDKRDVAPGDSLTPSPTQELGQVDDAKSPDTEAPSLSLKDAYEIVNKVGDKVNELTRQLAFTGFAIIWIFKENSGSSPTIPSALYLPGILLVFVLIIELVQLLIRSELTRFYTRRQEKLGKNAVTFPDTLPVIVDSLFWIKIGVVIAAYVLILRYLI